MQTSDRAGSGTRTVRRGPWTGIELANEEISVTLLPEKGCDILDLVDRRTGIDVLFKSPWGSARRPVHAPSSFEAWIESYPGGWQVLLPNGGDAAVENGVEWGFHGEAGLVEWRIDEAEPQAAVFSASLITAPLEIIRRVSITRNVLVVEEQVTNLGGDPIEVMWGHHPAFGAPFVEPGCTIETSAHTFTADDRAPGTGLEPGRRSTWPYAVRGDGTRIDLSVVPAPDERRAVLGYLSDFDDGWYRIVNPRLHLAVELRWPRELFPTAWFWQELHASPRYPWYRRAYTTALEPNTSAPGQGIANVRAKGGELLLLAPNVSRTATLEATLLAG